MSTPATAAATPSATWDWSPFRVVLPALAVGLLLLGVVFRQEVLAAVRTWNESTAYNHCILVLPIAGWLIWDRRFSLVGVPIVPAPLFALLSLPCIAAWLVAERLGIMEGRQLMLIGLVQVLCLSILGWRMYHALLGPLLYLFFLVPFGAFLTGRLQDFTTVFTLAGLDVLGIPYFSDGYIIQIAQGTFRVAEACAGLRFLIASVAFGVLYALIMYRSTWRRTIFIGISIVVPIIANGFRALGIVVLGRYLGSAEAAGADHLIYGWIFFSFVILLLVIFGLPFRQDTTISGPAAAPVPPSAGAARLSFIAMVLLIGIGASGAVAAARLDQSAALAPVPTLTGLTADTGCALVNIPAPPPTIPNSITQFFKCEGYTVAVQMTIFSPQTGAKWLLDTQRRMTGQLGADEITSSWLTIPGESQHSWQMIEMDDNAQIAATALWIDGKPTQIGLATRIQQAIRSVTGGTSFPVLVTVTPAGDWRSASRQYKPQAHKAIELFFQNEKSLSAQLARISLGETGPKP